VVKIAFLYGKRKESSAIYDHIVAFQEYSDNAIVYIDVLSEPVTSNILNQFDVVVVHFTITIFDDDRMPHSLRVLLRTIKAKKIVFIQDDYRSINCVVERLAYIKADVLFTEVNKKLEIEKVYPTSKLPNLIKKTMLAGYIPKNLLQHNRPSYEERPMDVIYRARKLPEWLGAFSREKFILGEKFSQDALKYNLQINISSRIEDRLFGSEWTNSLKQSKAALGCEGGASVFDFEGSLEESVSNYKTKHQNATFETIQKMFFKDLEDKIEYKMLTPRCFEYAAMGILMILYEGEYSGILKPWVHYVPLKKDHSNMDEIVQAIRNPNLWKEITDCAYQEVALNEEYSYKTAIKEFDDIVDRITLNKGIQEKIVSARITSPNFDNIILPQSNLSFYFIKVGRFLGYGIASCCNVFPKQISYFIDKQLVKIQSICFIFSKTIYRFIQFGDWKYVIYLWSKDFHKEYHFITDVINYCSSIKLTIGKMPITQSDTDILIDPDSMQHGANQIEQGNNIATISVANSCGLPKNIRGKRFFCKYGLAKKIMEIR
jgi:hypothetical protein